MVIGCSQPEKAAVMQRSAEIEQMARDAMAAIDQGDIDALLALVSRDAHATSIGTDPAEYSRDLADTLEMLRASSPDQSGGMRSSVTDVVAYEHGDVGWLDGTGTFTSGGQSVAVRFTNVVVREDGAWRLVQAHASIGVPNEHMFDLMLTSAAPAAG
jgi:ketosteroid isomerase-like protein